MSSARSLALVTAVFAITLAITAFSTLDWDLSHQLVSPGSNFGEFFNRFGEVPAFLALFISIFLLFGSRNRQVPWRNATGHLFALPFLALLAWALFFIPYRYIYEFNPNGVPEDALQLTQLLGGLLFFFAVIMAYRLPSSFFSKYQRPAMLIITVIFLEVLIVNLTKIAWGRPRMRSIDTIQQFHYWYQLAGPASGEEFKSFPSGHTANGFMIIVFSLVIPPEKTSLIRGFTLFAILWGVCVALSRVVLGAHFLSDVAAGAYIALILFYSTKAHFYK